MLSYHFKSTSSNSLRGCLGPWEQSHGTRWHWLAGSRCPKEILSGMPTIKIPRRHRSFLQTFGSVNRSSVPSAHQSSTTGLIITKVSFRGGWGPWAVHTASPPCSGWLGLTRLHSQPSFGAGQASECFSQSWSRSRCCRAILEKSFLSW